MAITRSQQAKQMLQDGGMLVKPSTDGKRPGYRSARAQEVQGRTSTYSGSTGKQGPTDNTVDDKSTPTQTANQLRNQNRFVAEDFDLLPGDTPVEDVDIPLTTRERITNQNRDLFINKPANYPGYVPPAAQFLGNLNRQPNRRFFYERVLNNNAAGLNYTQLEKAYEEYMQGRMSGETDAMGREIIQSGLDDDNNNNMILPVDTTFNMASSNMDQGTDTTEEDEGLRLAFRADGGRIGAQQGGIMPRLNELSGGVSSAEQMLQQINQRLESAESSLGEGDGFDQPLNPGNFQPATQPIGQPQPGSGFRGGETISSILEGLESGRLIPEGFEGPKGPGIVPGIAGGTRFVSNPAFSQVTPPQTPVAMQTPLSGIPAAGYAEGGPVGGEYDFETARQMYGLGKLVKKVTRAVKKVAKSPIGKAALLYAGTAGLGALGAGAARAGTGLGIFSPTNVFSNLGASKALLTNKLFGDAVAPNMTRSGGILQKALGFVKDNPFGAITAASVVAGALTPAQEKQAQELADETGIDIDAARRSILARAEGNIEGDVRMLSARADGGLMRLGYDEAGAVMSKEDMKEMAKSPLYKGFKTMYGVSPDMARDNKEYKGKFKQFEKLFKEGYQKGGDVEPVAKKTMPLLDMGGKEKDYRETGGFVDMGRMERADDVPARLSKNEFVFTADAVRNAGEGDIDKGAEVMYNMMKNLEAGGEVSEESQGLEGARRMFQTSQRLEEVL